MFYRIKNGKLYDYADNNYSFECQQTDLCSEVEYRETPNKFIVVAHEEQVEVPNYKTVTEEYQEPVYSEVEKTMVDENGEEITYIDFEITGYETKTREIQVEDGTKLETIVSYTLELNPNFEAEEAEKEKERISNLECTKRVFILMLQELGISYFNTIKPLIESNPQAQLEWELCVQLQRKNPLLDVVAGQLGVTSEQLDNLFKFANGEITLEDFKGSTSVEVSESEAGVEADGE